jgi:uncharacterized protein (TIGR02302 family)
MIDLTSKTKPSTSVAVFERKVRLSGWMLFLERLWPRLWIMLGIAAVFVALTIAGLWQIVGDTPHRVLLAGFAAAFFSAIVHAARTPFPARDASVRRLERVSALPHRPASSYEDTLTASAGDATTQAIWRAHKARLAALIGRLRIGRPEPRIDTRDPYALRALALLSAVLALGIAGNSASDRFQSAFRFGGVAAASDARIDAWVTPPGYTGKPPIMLADGARSVAQTMGTDKAVEVPERSILIIRSSAGPDAGLSIDVRKGGADTERVAAAAPKTAGDPLELRYEIKSSVMVTAQGAAAGLGTWGFNVIPDKPPRITLVKPPERTPRGSMKLVTKVEDDYGVVAAEAKVAKVPPAAGDPRTAWARAESLRGPRLPLERPPVLTLRLPRAGAKDGEATTYLELGRHPWAGTRVRMTLEAKDTAGQIGRTEPMDMVLPERQFSKPLARAVNEQRRKLIDDSRNRPMVVKALAALTLEPEGFIDDSHVYLGLRTVYHRLAHSGSRATLKSAVEQLWHIALRIEDGDLSDAERALREAQDKLSKALEDGASDSEIQSLMQDLRQALNNYMEQLSKQAEAQAMEAPNGLDPNSQTLSQQDLDRMMKKIEEMARGGSREQAQQMLSEMRDMLERLQSGRMAESQMRQGREMMKKMDELGNIVGDQQKLMDDTFGEQRRQGQGQNQGQRGQRGERGKGQQGQRGQDQQGGQGQQKGQMGQGGQRDEGQQGPGQGQTGSLGERQRQLREMLDKLQREMGELGMGSDKLDKAGEAMDGAERALRDGDLGQATEEQGRALEQMRDGAQQMAQQMMRNMPQRYGQSGESPRDPLGRPQRSQGPDLGTSVKVPDEIDMQRAREILDELRRRVGEPSRPLPEIDYLERLLKRY